MSGASMVNGAASAAAATNCQSHLRWAAGAERWAWPDSLYFNFFTAGAARLWFGGFTERRHTKRHEKNT